MSEFDIDNRHYFEFFEVHYWPHLGRVLTLNKPSGQDPVTMELVVSAGDYATFRADNTALVSAALAEAGDPSGELFRHNQDGSIEYVDKYTWASRPVVRQYPASTR